MDAVTGAIKRIAEIAFSVNEKTENIGARRLYTVMEKLLEEISFDSGKNTECKVDAAYVDGKLMELAKKGVVELTHLQRLALGPSAVKPA